MLSLCSMVRILQWWPFMFIHATLRLVTLQFSFSEGIYSNLFNGKLSICKRAILFYCHITFISFLSNALSLSIRSDWDSARMATGRWFKLPQIFDSNDHWSLTQMTTDRWLNDHWSLSCQILSHLVGFMWKYLLPFLWESVMGRWNTRLPFTEINIYMN